MNRHEYSDREIMRQVLKSLAMVVTVGLLIFTIPRLAHCFDVKPGGGVELFEIREMDDGSWAAGFNGGVSGGLVLNLGIIPLLDPQFKLSLHPGIGMGEGKFRLAGSFILGLFPWLDGKGRLFEGGIKKEFTGVPEGAANTWSILIMLGFGWGGGE